MMQISALQVGRTHKLAEYYNPAHDLALTVSMTLLKVRLLLTANTLATVMTSSVEVGEKDDIPHRCIAAA